MISMFSIISAPALMLSSQMQVVPPAEQETNETITSPSISDEGAVAEEGTSSQVEEENNRVICRRTAIIGSNFKRRLCATREEWENLSQRSQETTRELQKSGVGSEPIR